MLGIGRRGAPAAERLHAVIVADGDALGARGIVNVRELDPFRNRRPGGALPAHKRILSYDISTAPLPRTTTGKLKRPEIERAARGAPDRARRGRGPHARGGGMARRIRTPGAGRGRAHRFDRPRVRPDEHLELDLHLDSMERVELLSSLEERRHARAARGARDDLYGSPVGACRARRSSGRRPRHGRRRGRKAPNGTAAGRSS